MRSLLRLSALSAALLASAAAPVAAEELTTAQVFTGNQAYSGVGIHFTVNTSITVNALGLFDSGQDGFVAASSAPLTSVLWQVTDYAAGAGTALASETFYSGSSGTLNALTGYSFKPITALVLPAGEYVLAGYGWTLGGDPEHNCNVAGACDIFNTAGGALSYIDSPFGSGSDGPGVMPSTVGGFGTNHFFGGPSMQFDVTGDDTPTDMPEPASAALLLGGLAALGLRRRRR